MDRLPRNVQLSTSADTQIPLNPRRLYSINNLGKNAAGAASSNPIFGSCDGSAVEATYADAEGKIIIEDGETFPVPAGTSLIALKCTGAAVVARITATGWVPLDELG